MQPKGGFNRSRSIHERHTGTAQRSSVALAWWLICGCLVLAGCARPAADPEQQIRDWIDAVAAAAEQKQRGNILQLVSPAYTDARGNSYDDVDKTLRLYFLRQKNIVLLTTIDHINVSAGTAAEALVTVGMAGTDSSLLGIRADAYQFELQLEAAGGASGYEDWRLVAARWGELGKPLR